MIAMSASSCHTRIPRDLSPAANLCQEAAYDLVSSQLTFGLAYAQEARLAYRSGRADYGRMARNIALNAYSAALRFAARLPDNGTHLFSEQIADLKKQVDHLQEQDTSPSQSVA